MIKYILLAEPWTPLSCRPWVSTCCLVTKTHIQTACWLEGRLAASSATTASGNRYSFYLCNSAMMLAWQYREVMAIIYRPLGGAAGTAAGARPGGWCEIWAQILQPVSGHHGKCAESGTWLGPHVSEFENVAFGLKVCFLLKVHQTCHSLICVPEVMLAVSGCRWRSQSCGWRGSVTSCTQATPTGLWVTCCPCRGPRSSCMQSPSIKCCLLMSSYLSCSTSTPSESQQQTYMCCQMDWVLLKQY